MTTPTAGRLRTTLGSAVVRTAASNLALPASALLTGPLLARGLGETGRGQYAALTALASLIGTLGTLGLQDSLTRACAESGCTLTAAIRQVLRALPALIAVNAVVIVVVVTTAFHGLQHPVLACAYTVASTIVFLVISLMAGIAVGVGRFAIVNLNRSVTAAIRLAAFATMFFVGGITVESSLLVFGGAALVAATAMAHQLRRAAATEPSTAPAPTGLWRYAFTVCPGLLATIGLSRIDQVIALPVIGARQLGLYAVAVSIAEAPMAISAAYRTFYMGRTEVGVPTSADYLAAVRRAGLMTVVVAGLGALVAPVALPLLFGQHFKDALPATWALLAAAPALSVSSTATGILLRHGWARDQTICVTGALVVNVVLIFALRQAHSLGLALASLVAYTVSAGLACRAITVRFPPPGPRDRTLGALEGGPR